MPSGCKPFWDDMGVWDQAKLVAYHQTCEEDEHKEMAAMAGARMPGMPTGRK